MSTCLGMDYDDQFASGDGSFVIRADFGRSGADQLLVNLGKLAGYCDLRVVEFFGEHGHQPSGTMRRFVDDDRHICCKP